MLLTKDGQPISFNVSKSKDAEPESPWIQYTIMASVGDRTTFRKKSKGVQTFAPLLLPHTHHFTRETGDVGYIKLGWITKEYWNEHFPTLWHFAIQAGWGGVRDVLAAVAGKDMKQWTPEQKSLLVNQVDGYLNFYYTNGMNGAVTPENVETIWKQVNLSLKRQLLERCTKFKAYNVDRPIVDFIRVDATRQHVGLALYSYGATWLHEQFGLFLYGSTNQTEPAEKVWEHMENKGLVVNSIRGRHLRPDILT